MCDSHVVVYDDLFEVDDEALVNDAFTLESVDLLMQAAMAVNAAGGSARVLTSEDQALSDIDDA